MHNLDSGEHNRNLQTYGAALNVFGQELTASAKEMFLGVARIGLSNLSDIAASVR